MLTPPKPQEDRTVAPDGGGKLTYADKTPDQLRQEAYNRAVGRGSSQEQAGKSAGAQRGRNAMPSETGAGKKEQVAGKATLREDQAEPQRTSSGKASLIGGVANTLTPLVAEAAVKLAMDAVGSRMEAKRNAPAVPDTRYPSGSMPSGSTVAPAGGNVPSATVGLAPRR